MVTAATSSTTTTTLLLLFLSSYVVPAAYATRHSFITKNDARYFIGPIGVPYGFLKDGVYNLTVFDFELFVDDNALTAHSDKEQSDNDDDDDKQKEKEKKELLKGIEAGFILRKFESESEYARYETTIKDDPSICSFEPYREHDGISHSDDDNDNNNDPLSGNDDDETYKQQHDKEEHTTFASTDGIYLSLNNPSKTWKPNKPTVTHTFSPKEEGLYFLLFQICPTTNNNNKLSTKNNSPPSTSVLHNIRTTFELDLKYHNYDTFGSISYLTAGEMKLPTMFLYFSISYGLCLGIWVSNIRTIRMKKYGGGRGSNSRGKSQQQSQQQPVIHSIHHMMTILLALKTFSVFFESVRYHYIRLSGHAELWSVVYYTLAFVKGMFLFTVILLIGSGWSFVKPFLNDREKKVICLVLVLQVIDNIAVVVMTHGMVGERLYEDWSAVLHLVDILCCCAVLVPIVWQVNSLEASMETRAGGTENNNDGGDEEEENGGEVGNQPSSDDARMLSKLKMFRSFYLLVVVYIYFTRIIVYLFATVLGFRHTWLRYFVTELGTLAFYCVVGLQFRPMVENPYLELKREEEDGSYDDRGYDEGESGGLEMSHKA